MKLIAIMPKNGSEHSQINGSITEWISIIVEVKEGSSVVTEESLTMLRLSQRLRLMSDDINATFTMYNTQNMSNICVMESSSMFFSVANL